ncbi:MAG: transposase [Acidobacteriota bacterium]
MTSTHDDQSPATIIKSDRTGRRRYTREYKNEVLAAYESSGMSGPAFAEHCGLKYPTFASWVSKRRREETGGEAPENHEKFVLAEFAAATGPEGIAIELPGGANARLADSRQVELLAALIKALA